MATYSRFEELKVWQASRGLRAEIRSLVINSGINRDFNLKDQITRSSRSVMANIAEGFERGTTQEFIRFLYIAKGSCGETRNHLFEAFDEKYMDEPALNTHILKCEDVSSQLSNFIRYLALSDKKTRTANPNTPKK